MTSSSDLNKCECTSVEKCDIVDNEYIQLKAIFTAVCNKHCPFVTRRVKKCILAWLTDFIRMKH